MKKTFFLLALITISLIGQGQQNKRTIVERNNRVIKTHVQKTSSTQIKKLNKDERSLNPQPLPPVDGGGGKKALNPQPLPPKSGQSNMKRLNPQPEPPGYDKNVNPKALNPQLLPSINSGEMKKKSLNRKSIQTIRHAAKANIKSQNIKKQ